MSMEMAARRGAWLALVVVAAAVPACTRTEPAPQGRTEATATKVQYPEPRFPSYLKPPKSVDDVMPQARLLARNKSGFQGAGFGVAGQGDTILLVTSLTSEDMIMQAIVKALDERGVKAILKPDYDVVGVSKDDAEALRTSLRGYTSEQGYMEAANFIDTQFPDPDKFKAWFREQRPDLYDQLFPKTRELTAHQKEVRKKLEGENVGAELRKYLEKNPNVRGVFWGKGGGTTLRRYMHPLENRFIGLMVFDNRYDVMSALGNYPGDVWQLAEEQGMEPIVHVDRIEAKDPEGTDVWADLTQDMAERWSRGVYQRGHLYMFPNQATGRFGYSVVDYPAFQGEYLQREPMALLQGTIAGTTNHTGFFPQWKVKVDGGKAVDVVGGGTMGEVLRTTMKYPGINDKVYPFHAENHPGYFWLYEIAFGTHPKAFRNPMALEQGTAIPERLRAGVIHWGIGVTIHHEPGSPTKSPALLKFTAENNLPRDHGWHTHTYFTTYRVHLRNTDKWITLLDKGHFTPLDDPEVRALASRYGNPDDLLTEDWRPEIPGINASGNYETDYAPNPWKTVKAVLDQVAAGTYPHFFPNAPKAPPTQKTN